MKKSGVIGIAIGLMLFVSCGKQETEAEKNAEIERQVQQRLAAERQATEQRELAQREAEITARENALVQKEQEPVESATPQMRATEIQQRDTLEAEQRTEQLGGDKPESYNTFYTKLEPYGAWREISDYGYVWQPKQAQHSRNWRPYTNGRWVYTDAGWTWDSEEPFGWATYHYGRWTRLRNVGWVWIPGDEWAPAWVAWRRATLGRWGRSHTSALRRRTASELGDNYSNRPGTIRFVPTNDWDGATRTHHCTVARNINMSIKRRPSQLTIIIGSA